MGLQVLLKSIFKIGKIMIIDKVNMLIILFNLLLRELGRYYKRCKEVKKESCLQIKNFEMNL